MPTHPGRDPLTPGRIASAKVLRLGLTALTNKHRAIQARRRVADFLNLAVAALTVDTENHDGDGAPALAGTIIDGLVRHELAVLAAFLADDQPRTLRAQIAAAIALWSEADRAA